MFNSLKIRGGVHAEERKDISSAVPINTLGLPPLLKLPLRQHSGESALPVVAVGDNVLRGQLIASAQGDVSAAIHAPTSGKVTAISEITAPHPSQLTTLSIIIEPDGSNTPLYTDLPKDPMQLSPEEIANRVDQAGIVGMGGATFPSALKLKSGARNEIDTLILNGSECEPYLTCDDLIMRERAEGIIDGGRMMQKAIGAHRIVAAIEDNKPEAIAAMKAAAEPFDDISVQVIPARYPMGSAKQMIQAVMGQEVPPGGRSADVGAIVHNVATAYAIHRALRLGEPLISRVVTVSGQGVKKPQNVEVLLGTPMDWVIEQCGGMSEQVERVVMGGPMMGQILPDWSAPVTKGTSGVLALENPEINSDESSPCIRCASCVDACPMGLVPLEMARNARADNFDGAVEYGLKDCILCGSCAYVCPSHIPLVHYFQFAKGEMSDLRQQAKKTELTKFLSQQREARKQKEAEAKAAAKAAKAAKAAEMKARKAKQKAAAATEES